MSSVFKKMGGVCATQDHGDPVVLYDRMANRWFLTQFSWVNVQTGPFHQSSPFRRRATHRALTSLMTSARQTI